MYRLLTETLLGVNLEGDQLRLTPRMPKVWTTYKIHYRYRQTVYHITIARLPADSTGGGVLTLDGREMTGGAFPLRDDRNEHAVEMKVSCLDGDSPGGEAAAETGERGVGHTVNTP